MTHLGQKTAAVIVSYFPDSDFFFRIERLLQQVSYIVVVDNCSDSASRIKLQNINNEKFIFLQNDSNRGVASAFNRGTRYAFDFFDIDYVLHLDQDSVLNNGVIEKLEIALDHIKKAELKLGILGINYIDLNRGGDAIRVPIRHSNHLIEEMKTLISSGSLISRNLWVSEGPLEDDLFIDHVDDEYCLRLNAKGYKHFIATQAILHHRIGKSECKKILGKSVYPMNQTAFRWFYVSRNLTILSIRYFKKDRQWVLGTIFMVFKRAVKMLVYEKKRFQKVVAISKGFLFAFSYDTKN